MSILSGSDTEESKKYSSEVKETIYSSKGWQQQCLEHEFR